MLRSCVLRGGSRALDPCAPSSRGSPRAHRAPSASGLGLLSLVAALSACSGPYEEPSEALATAEQEQTCVTFQRAGAADGAVADTMLVYDPSDPFKEHTNFGAVQQITVGFSGWATQSGVVRFDLAKIPAWSIVRSATMTFRLIQSPGKGDIYMHRVTLPWAEATATWESFMTAADKGYDKAILADVRTQGVPSGTELRVDWTPIVAAWVSGTYPNHGALLEHPDPGRAVIGSSEAPALASRPRLVVCYDLPRSSGGA